MADDFVRMMKEKVMSYFKAPFWLSSTDINTNPETSKTRIACNPGEIRTGYHPNTSLFTKVAWKQMTGVELMLWIWLDHHSCRDELMKTNISALTRKWIPVFQVVAGYFAVRGIRPKNVHKLLNYTKPMPIHLYLCLCSNSHIFFSVSKVHKSWMVSHEQATDFHKNQLVYIVISWVLNVINCKKIIGV
jgi:hypothetical protein